MTRPEAAPLFPPPGYVRWSQGPHDVVALEPVSDAVRAALEEATSLYTWAARHAERTHPPRRVHPAAGRGPVHAVRLGSWLAAIRHYRRGGWMAPLLTDRYLDSPPRPFAELAASDRLLTAGVPTARVLAAVVTGARPGYRADLATEWLEPGHDLVALLAPNQYPAAERAAALEAAGRTIARAHRAGLDHADLNLTNVFVQPRLEDNPSWTATLLDLDRARFVAPGEPAFKKKTFAGSGDRSTRPVARAA